MNGAEWLGSIGVGLILLAFASLQLGFSKATTPLYLVANLVGAGLACVSSILIGFLPFVILEAVWALVAACALIGVVWRSVSSKGASSCDENQALSIEPDKMA